MTRDSSTQLSVVLAFDGTDFDEDGEITFTVMAAALATWSADLSSGGLAVSAVVEAELLVAHWLMDNDAN